MTKHIVFRIVAGLFLLAAIAAIGFFAFRAGVGYGASANLELPVVDGTVPFHPYYGMHHFGGGLFGLLFVLFLVSLAFGAMRRLIWGPRWGWRHMHGPMTGHGPMGHGPCGEGVPPMFNEWHKRAHEAPASAEQPAGKKTGE